MAAIESIFRPTCHGSALVKMHFLKCGAEPTSNYHPPQNLKYRCVGSFCMHNLSRPRGPVVRLVHCTMSVRFQTSNRPHRGALRHPLFLMVFFSFYSLVGTWYLTFLLINLWAQPGIKGSGQLIPNEQSPSIFLFS